MCGSCKLIRHIVLLAEQGIIYVLDSFDIVDFQEKLDLKGIGTLRDTDSSWMHVNSPIEINESEKIVISNRLLFTYMCAHKLAVIVSSLRIGKDQWLIQLTSLVH